MQLKILDIRSVTRYKVFLYSNMGNDFVPIWSPLEHTSSRDQGYQSSDKILLVIYGIFDVNGHILSLNEMRSDLSLVCIRHSEL